MPHSPIDPAGLQVAAEDFLVAVLETTAQPIRVVDPNGVIRLQTPPPSWHSASVYFVVAEALTDVVKHSQATRAQVMVVVADRTLRIEVRDDGNEGGPPRDRSSMTR